MKKIIYLLLISLTGCSSTNSLSSENTKSIIDSIESIIVTDESSTAYIPNVEQFDDEKTTTLELAENEREYQGIIRFIYTDNEIEVRKEKPITFVEKSEPIVSEDPEENGQLGYSLQPNKIIGNIKAIAKSNGEIIEYFHDNENYEYKYNKELNTYEATYYEGKIKNMNFVVAQKIWSKQISKKAGTTVSNIWEVYEGKRSEIIFR